MTDLFHPTVLPPQTPNDRLPLQVPSVTDLVHLAVITYFPLCWLATVLNILPWQIWFTLSFSCLTPPWWPPTHNTLCDRSGAAQSSPTSQTWWPATPSSTLCDRSGSSYCSTISHRWWPATVPLLAHSYRSGPLHCSPTSHPWWPASSKCTLWQIWYTPLFSHLTSLNAGLLHQVHSVTDLDNYIILPPYIPMTGYPT
jgi:hypothetical protein